MCATEVLFISTTTLANFGHGDSFHQFVRARQGQPRQSPSWKWTNIANLEHIGSHKFGRHPRGIFYRLAFNPEDVKDPDRLFGDVSSSPVAWIAGDPSVIPQAYPGADYAEKAAENVKREFQKWSDDGANNRDIIYY